MKEYLCIYHGNCQDGQAAAWVVYDYFMSKKSSEFLHFHPGFYGAAPPYEQAKGKYVIIVDFSYPAAQLAELARFAEHVLVLDHHETAAKELAGFDKISVESGYFPEMFAKKSLVHVLFDMEKSGAGLAEAFFRKGLHHPLIELVQDRDLWRFKLSDSKAFHAFLSLQDFSLEHWDRIFGPGNNRTEYIRQGYTALQVHDQSVKRIIKSSLRMGWIAGYFVPIVNCPYEFASDIGNIICEGHPFGATYFDSSNGREFSLRSKEGGIKVNDVATIFGGGGHPRAAGFHRSHGWGDNEEHSFSSDSEGVFSKI